MQIGDHTHTAHIRNRCLLMPDAQALIEEIAGLLMHLRAVCSLSTDNTLLPRLYMLSTSVSAAPSCLRQQTSSNRQKVVYACTLRFNKLQPGDPGGGIPERCSVGIAGLRTRCMTPGAVSAAFGCCDMLGSHTAQLPGRCNCPRAM